MEGRVRLQRCITIIKTWNSIQCSLGYLFYLSRSGFGSRGGRGGFGSKGFGGGFGAAADDDSTR